MKRFAGWAMAATLVLAVSGANAQMLAPYQGVSDLDGPYGRPYADVPPAPPPVYNYGGYGPSLLPPQEVYAVLRDNGFSPLGVPHQRGYVYFIAAVDRRGESGRLVIDARNGQILRFAPSYGYGPYGGNFEMEPMSGYGPEQAPPPPTVIRGLPQTRTSAPHVASRAVPLPTPKPTAVAKPAGPPLQQSAAIETRPATSPAAQASNAAPPSTASVGEGKAAAPMIRPTQEMPAAQGLE